jgi:HAD superfamily hydrolase (TIGR01549 family)
MGGDQLVGSLCGEQVDREQGDSIREDEGNLYMALIDEVRPFADARRLVDTLKARGHKVVLASSAKRHEVDHYLDLLNARDVVHGWTTSGDVERTKPHPDLVAAAMEKAGTKEGVMVGDSTWDCQAAKRAGVPTIAVLTGGFSEQELRNAGAATVFESLAAVLEQLDRTPLGRQDAVRAVS